MSVAQIFGTVMKDMEAYNVISNNSVSGLQNYSRHTGTRPGEVTPVVQSEYMHVHTITYSSCNMISLTRATER